MPGYQVLQEQVAVSGVADLQIRALLDRQQFADADGAAAALGISSAQWPLFGLLWPSGRHLAQHMAQRALVPGERILEIGCGLALASLVCHRRGADVTASDCHPLAGAFLRENLRLNDLPPLPYRHGHWGVLTDGQAAAALARSAVAGRFNLIIGSDVLYERDEAGTLAGFLDDHLQPCAEVLIVDPDRGNRGAFNRHMLRLGFALQTHTLGGAAGGPAAAAYKGRLLQYSRAAAAGWHQEAAPAC
jgi:predicted nicotinamide N-methyase